MLRKMVVGILAVLSLSQVNAAETEVAQIDITKLESECRQLVAARDYHLVNEERFVVACTVNLIDLEKNQDAYNRLKG